MSLGFARGRHTTPARDTGRPYGLPVSVEQPGRGARLGQRRRPRPECGHAEARKAHEEAEEGEAGAEGDTGGPEVLRLRKQLAKNHICHLLFSSGTPMLLGGDEFLRTQKGNNNAYCQDNALAWFDWGEAERNGDFLQFVQKAVAFLKRHPILQRRKFFLGRDLNANGVPDLAWFNENGTTPDWNDPELRTICLQLDGGEAQPGRKGDYLLYFILNADPTVRSVQLPALSSGKKWRRVIDTSLEAGEDFLDEGREIEIKPAGYYLANPRSTVVLLGR